MRLQRVRVEQLRQFRQPFELADLAPGLNLIAGPNEAGKSTLVRAIRAAFFERHRSTSVDDLLPWGDPSATPTVELDFTVGATAYRLRKSFLHRKRCELKAGPLAFDGEDAEQHLAELLGFEYALRGASKPEHWGVPGLLWIEQGSAQEIGNAVGHATDHLRKALDQSAGEVASSHGDELVARVRAERNLLLTPGTGKPRGAYAEVIAEQAAAAAQRDALDARIEHYRQQVDQLGQWRAEHAADAAARPWEALRAEQQQAEARLAAVESLKARLDADRAALAQADDKLGLVSEQIGSFDDQQRAYEARAAELQQAEARVQAAQSADDTWAAARQHAEADYRDAAEALAAARQEDLRADLARRIAEAQARAATLDDTIARAEAEQAQLIALRAQAVASELAKADLVRLRALRDALTELRIRREAAATRVRFDLDASAEVSLAGERLGGSGERLITVDAALDIAGVGRLQIVPGGADLADLARRESEQRAVNDALLQRLRLADVDEAEARFAAHQQTLKDIQHGEKALAHLAPAGLDELRGERAVQAARQAEAQAQAAQLPAPAAEPPMALAAATSRQQAAAEQLDKIGRQAAEARLALHTAQTQRDAARREREQSQAVLDDPARRQRVGDAGQRLLLARAERDALAQRVAAAEAELEAARPDIVRQDLERFKRSAEQAERAYHDRQTALTLLQGKLEEAGAQGLEGERAELAVRADAADRRRRELARRAEALELLLELMEARRRELTRRLQAPLQKHVNRYLQLLLPQATLDIGENLAPGRLTRPPRGGSEASGPVDELSFGAREQMGVISRLAYADLLKDAGRPTLIILDDALVHSDEARLAQMKRVLFDAAQRHQVLLFTCHPAAWRDMGVAPRMIAGSVV